VGSSFEFLKRGVYGAFYNVSEEHMHTSAGTSPDPRETLSDGGSASPAIDRSIAAWEPGFSLAMFYDAGRRCEDHASR
jgi:hypothetical protein